MRAPQLAPLVALGGLLYLHAQIPEIRIEGGSPDDRILARAALGRPPVLDQNSLEQGRAAILASDRFRSVQTGLDGAPWVRLDPWPALREVQWRGDKVAGPLLKSLLPSLRTGIRVGERRREAWRLFAEGRLKEAGYPEAKVALVREDGDHRMAVVVALGPPALIQRLEWQGQVAPYESEKLLKTMGIIPGRSLWNEALRRSAQASLRKRFLKDRRYEGGVEFEWLGAGALRVKIQPGPRIQVAFEGQNLPWWGLKAWVPLYTAGRFSRELYEEGDRRLFRHFLEEGFLDVKVSHRLDTLAGPEASPEEIRLTYMIQLGPRVFAEGLRFEGNQALKERELRKAADLPSRDYATLWARPPKASPERLAEAEARVRTLYLQRGFPEVRVRRRLERKGERTLVTFSIREGERRELRDLELDVPKGPGWAPMELGESLLQVIADRPVAIPGREDRVRRYRGDRSSGTLSWLPGEPGGTTERVHLRLDPPIPFVKSDLAPVLTALRQKVAALGAPRPLDRLEPFEAEEGRLRVRITVPPQPLAQVRRLTLFGADDTRARGLVREAQLAPGDPLDPRALAGAQVRIGNLRSFQRVDLMGMQDTSPGPVPGPSPWQPGDLILGLEERSPWALSGGFGYDKSQGYHFTGGVQRLNLLGEGESVDLGFRAGDATFNSETLRKTFPTGSFNRSIDSFGITYTDPSLGLKRLGSWLPDRAQFRSEWTYIKELQTAFKIQRRRVLNDLEWRIDSRSVFRLGHRFERVEVAAAVEKVNDPDFLNKAAQTPSGGVVISSPIFQYLRDSRDNPFDPTRGTYFSARLELANQAFGTSSNTSFVKVDLRYQRLWPIGRDGKAGVLAAGVRIGIARPTDHSANELPLSERFFAGGPFTHRGVEPDFLGPRGSVDLIDPDTHLPVFLNGYKQTQTIPLGGQAMALVNLEYRFPISGQFAGEIFLDSGQVYQYLQQPDEGVFIGSDSLRPPFLTALGGGLMFKVGIPIKVEYAVDVRRILGKLRSAKDRETQLKGVLISAGFQF